MTIYQQKRVMFYLIIGITIGSILALMNYLKITPVLPYLFFSFYGLLILLAFPTAQSFIRLFTLSIIFSFLASIPFIDHSFNLPFSLFLLAFISAYALTSFHTALQTSLKISYENLFYIVWDLFIQCGIAIIFAGVSWLILILWAELFAFISIDFFKHLFVKTEFIIFASSFLISVGLYISYKKHTIIRQIQHIFLLMVYYLLPVFALIGVAFLIAGIISVVFLHHAATLMPRFLLFLSFFSVILLNGVYQYGQTKLSYHRFIFIMCKIFIYTMPFFTLLGLHTIYFFDANSIQKNGLNDDNFYFLIAALLLLSYKICYAIIALLREKPWLKSIKKVNVVLAIILIMTTLLTINPWIIKKIPKAHLVLSHNVKKQVMSLEKSGLFWIPLNQQSLLLNGIIMGYNPKAIYICRTKIKGEDVGGILQDKTCMIIHQQKILNTSQFTLLTGPTNKIVWGSYYPQETLISVSDSIPTYFCRSIYHNQIVVGTVNKGNCRFIVNDEIVEKQVLEYLHLRESVSASVSDGV